MRGHGAMVTKPALSGTPIGMVTLTERATPSSLTIFASGSVCQHCCRFDPRLLGCALETQRQGPTDRQQSHAIGEQRPDLVDGEWLGAGFAALGVAQAAASMGSLPRPSGAASAVPSTHLAKR